MTLRAGMSIGAINGSSAEADGTAGIAMHPPHRHRCPPTSVNIQAITIPGQNSSSNCTSRTTATGRATRWSIGASRSKRRRHPGQAGTMPPRKATPRAPTGIRPHRHHIAVRMARGGRGGMIIRKGQRRRARPARETQIKDRSDNPGRCRCNHRQDRRNSRGQSSANRAIEAGKIQPLRPSKGAARDATTRPRVRVAVDSSATGGTIS